MRELVIGSDGFIGSRLLELTGGVGTSRRVTPGLQHYMDLSQLGSLPGADVAYICAGVNGAMNCEGNPKAYTINVDSTIRLAEHYSKTGFAVWISSTTVMWSDSCYARWKQVTESYLRTLPNVGIVRAGRVVKSNLDDLCNTLIEVGRNKLSGLHLWGEDEKPYEK